MGTSKQRTPSKCRKWEQERRNKFNSAIIQLGKEVRRVSGELQKEQEQNTAIYPKIEIIQQAIVTIKEIYQEKLQLKAELLALQVRIQEEENRLLNMRDVSTEMDLTPIKNNSTCGKETRTTLENSNSNIPKEQNYNKTSRLKCKKSFNSEVRNSDSNRLIAPKITKILSGPTLSDKSKRVPENTIVVLPAAPYMIPRQLLFPAVPPSFFLLDSALQTSNRNTIPIIPRVSNEITKTTMVNIVPISAYSHPLSVTKGRKKITNKLTAPKTKNDRLSKKSVTSTKLSKKQRNNQASENDFKEKSKMVNSDKLLNDNETQETVDLNSTVNTNNSSVNVCIKDANIQKNQTTLTKSSDNRTRSSEYINKENGDTVTKAADSSPKLPEVETNNVKTTGSFSIKTTNSISTENVSSQLISCEKHTSLHENQPEHVSKEKHDKLSSILDSNLCENAADGGNARLELAEEFLAASPTAAFLMTFPLVSGNRPESPCDDQQNIIQPNSSKSIIGLTSQQRQINCEEPTNTISCCDKISKDVSKLSKSDKNDHHTPNTNYHKEKNQSKTNDNNINVKDNKDQNTSVYNTAQENPFLNLSLPSVLPASCVVADSSFALDFDCNLSKNSTPNYSSSYTNANLLYKNDMYNSVKNTIYNNSGISSSHEFNSLGLYPCAMEKYATKNVKSDYTNVDDSLMKIGSTRLTYDVDLGWPHKSLDFVNSSTSNNTFNKENIFATASVPLTSSSNLFNSDLNASLVNTSNKKSNNKFSTSYTDTITNLYSQPSVLWPEELAIYNSNNVSTPKLSTPKSQNFPSIDNSLNNNNHLKSASKQFDSRTGAVESINDKSSASGTLQQASDKHSKKSPNKMHINWMTSEVRSMQNNNYETLHGENRDQPKSFYTQLDQHQTKKQDFNDTNYFPIPLHNLPTQIAQDDFQVWPSARPLASAEICMEPPPINLPTLVGDLALGPNEKKKNAEMPGRGSTQPELANCNSFFSVTQLMNRSSDNVATSRYQGSHNEVAKPYVSKQNLHFSNGSTDKISMCRLETNFMQPCFVYNDPKITTSRETSSQFPQNKSKSKSYDKTSKSYKNNYSAEALLRGGNCNQKQSSNNSATRFMPSQKYMDFNATQETPIAQVSHFPPILDYSDNMYSNQQHPVTTYYSSTTNTMSTSFYSNFMTNSSNLMPTNYASSNYTGDFVDYVQSECNFAHPKYEDIKSRNNSTTLSNQERILPSNYKLPRRDTIPKHKLECSKKDPSRKYQSKRPKISTDVDEWPDTSNIFWQNRVPAKKQGSGTLEELHVPNYLGNQAPSQYQPDLFNSNTSSSTMLTMGSNTISSSFSTSSRANFNLSTIFPEITMKVQ